jgi:phospholipid/cholesterol/gamma-HCH transport system permease protein
MDFLSKFGRYLLMIRGMFSKPENGKMYWKEFMHQCSEIGIGSLGIVVIISIFMGAVSALQTAYQLTTPIIPKETIAQIVRDTVILEFSPTLVCIVLAGVVGSKIASELGNMRVSEQIDALEIMGVNTKTYLVLPKNSSLPGCHSNASDYFSSTRRLGWTASWTICGNSLHYTI